MMIFIKYKNKIIIKTDNILVDSSQPLLYCARHCGSYYGGPKGHPAIRFPNNSLNWEPGLGRVLTQSGPTTLLC